jgi:hypothetical protein
MQTEGLIALVPIHTRDGRPYRIALLDIPKPWRRQLAAALI